MWAISVSTKAVEVSGREGGGGGRSSWDSEPQTHPPWPRSLLLRSPSALYLPFHLPPLSRTLPYSPALPHPSPLPRSGLAPPLPLVFIPTLPPPPQINWPDVYHASELAQGNSTYAEELVARDR